MYNTTNTAGAIKAMAIKRGVSIAALLKSCGLGKDAVNTMARRGSWLQADSLAKIADALDCSVDYLLDRTDNPDSHKQTVSIGGNVENGGGNVAIGAHNTINAAPVNEQETALMDKYKALDPVQKAKLLLYADKLLNGK